MITEKEVADIVTRLVVVCVIVMLFAIVSAVVHEYGEEPAKHKPNNKILLDR